MAAGQAVEGLTPPQGEAGVCVPEIVKAHVGETGPGADPDPVVVQPDALPRPALPRCRKHPSAGPLERIEDDLHGGTDAVG